jgi:hypothetical protein
VSLPKPEQGLVIRYSYLWHSEARRGQEEGRKDRPCAVVLAITQPSSGALRVMVAPITHTPPSGDSTARELPPRIAQHLGLDGARSWIVTSEVNVFTWPGPDVRAARGKDFAFGHLPNMLARQVRDDVIVNMRKRPKPVERDEARD